MKRLWICYLAGSAFLLIWGLHGFLVGVSPADWLGRPWSKYWIHGSLILLWVGAAVLLASWSRRRRSFTRLQTIVLSLLAVLALTIGLFLRLASSWQQSFLDPASCRAPLQYTEICVGFDEGFQEAYSARLARGRPKKDDCERFIAPKPKSKIPAMATGVCEIRNAFGWKEVDCRTVALGNESQTWRCFVCDHQDALGLRLETLLAFSDDCQRAVSFVGENVGRSIVNDWIKEGRFAN